MIKPTIGNRQLLVVPIMAALVEVGTQIQTHSAFAFENQSLIIEAIGKKEASDLVRIISQTVSSFKIPK